MKRNISHVFFLIILLFSILNFSSCSNREETVSCFPSTPINVVLNLNLPTYFTLQNVGGWIYINEQQSGTRGLIIVRTTTGFKVYDRNAPHICPDSNTTLSVENDIKIVCPKDGAEWITITGEPTKISQVPPKTYPYSYDTYTKILSVYY
ncbi:hypothetical protein Q73A0000_15110 [Kaistella flava (ex Peng et al. 2021)]|uniref:Rieske domain-containing protein n=1 Tax=Kaistella flava (ex Peng et al. 2021) TaxID=2038776 RepID=A0A7M2YBG3_9FLAO|nr:hypothetical protein [Kaistella flava (ex Peng et al. 2021)]QOW11608.1 hypothetical protein Q73A0000_15110 [Kaistella flava (ex Peng et al. 2021)]